MHTKTNLGTSSAPHSAEPRSPSKDPSQPSFSDDGTKPATAATLTTSMQGQKEKDQSNPLLSDDEEYESFFGAGPTQTPDQIEEEEVPEDNCIPTLYQSAGLHASLIERHRRRQRIDTSHVTPFYANRRIVGSSSNIRDAMDHRNSTTSCTCRNSKCLKLYCACFAAANYCSSDRCQCVNCGNTSDPAQANARHDAVVQAVTRYPKAFRALHSTDESAVLSPCGNSRCRCFVTGMHCDPSDCTCSACHGLPKRQKRFYNGVDSTIRKSSSTKSAANTPVGATTQNTTHQAATGAGNPVSIAPLPLIVDEKVVPGLSFVRASSTVPVSLSNTSGDSDPPNNSKNNASKFVVHDLMLEPSKVVASTPPPPPPQRPVDVPASQPTAHYDHNNLSSSLLEDRWVEQMPGTELEQHWHREKHDLRTFLATIQAELQQRQQQQKDSSQDDGAEPISTSASAPTTKDAQPVSSNVTTPKTLERHAKLVLSSIEQDLMTVHKVGKAAELDVLTRLLGQRRSSSMVLGSSTVTSPASKEEKKVKSRTRRHHQVSGRATSLQRATTTTSTAGAGASTTNVSSSISALLCQEVLPENVATSTDVAATSTASSHPPTNCSKHEVRPAIVAAAREAAMFRETARILKRKARELCRHRLLRKQGSTTTFTTSQSSSLVAATSVRAPPMGTR